MKKVTISYYVPNRLEAKYRIEIARVLEDIEVKKVVFEIEEIGGNTDE
ncbi:hypothetical protein [Velocimicrobium porci]|nr:hypothetical protein [Velocimicrobium porci]